MSLLPPLRKSMQGKRVKVLKCPLNLLWGVYPSFALLFEDDTWLLTSIPASIVHIIPVFQGHLVWGFFFFTSLESITCFLEPSKLQTLAPTDACAHTGPLLEGFLEAHMCKILQDFTQVALMGQSYVEFSNTF